MFWPSGRSMAIPSHPILFFSLSPDLCLIVTLPNRSYAIFSHRNRLITLCLFIPHQIETHKGKNLEVEEAEHHEHSDEISPELEALLQTDPKHGLTTAEAAERLARFGPNELAEVKRNPLLKFLSYFTGAI